MPRLQFSGLTGKASLTEPGASSAVALSQAPIPQALVAASDPAYQRRVFVLADDLRWRRVDAPVRLCARSDMTSAPPLTRRAISPDATKLALPQPDRLVVIDVRSGSSRSYAAGGASNTHALWADRTHVLVTEDGALHGSLVDIVSGTVTPSPHGRTTAFTDRGLSLDWGPDPSVSGHCLRMGPRLARGRLALDGAFPSTSAGLCRQTGILCPTDEGASVDLQPVRARARCPADPPRVEP